MDPRQPSAERLQQLEDLFTNDLVPVIKQARIEFTFYSDQLMKLNKAVDALDEELEEEIQGIPERITNTKKLPKAQRVQVVENELNSFIDDFFEEDGKTTKVETTELMLQSLPAGNPISRATMKSIQKSLVKIGVLMPELESKESKLSSLNDVNEIVNYLSDPKNLLAEMMGNVEEHSKRGFANFLNFTKKLQTKINKYERVHEIIQEKCNSIKENILGIKKDIEEYLDANKNKSLEPSAPELTPPPDYEQAINDNNDQEYSSSNRSRSYSGSENGSYYSDDSRRQSFSASGSRSKSPSEHKGPSYLRNPSAAPSSNPPEIKIGRENQNINYTENAPTTTHRTTATQSTQNQGQAEAKAPGATGRKR